MQKNNITIQQLRTLLKKYPNAILYLHGGRATGKTRTAKELFPDGLTAEIHSSTTCGLREWLCLPAKRAVIVNYDGAKLKTDHSSLFRSFHDKQLPVTNFNPPDTGRPFTAERLVLTNYTTPADAQLMARCIVVECTNRPTFRLRLTSLPTRS